MCILWSVVHQQQQSCRSDRIGEKIQKCLGLLVDPVQVLKDDHQRLVERFSQQNSLERLERAPLADVRVHLREWIVALDDPEQREQIWQRVFE